MKKLKLTVAEPCHETWEGMTPEQRGRFCAACQKKVVDFTLMSDGQLADFFEKPTGSVCGRFYNDQLNRELTLPEKRYSLPKHFFRYSWPAFLLLLKSCDDRKDDRFKILGAPLEITTPEMIPMMGNVLPEITPVDSTVDVFTKPIPIECSETVGITGVVLKGDTTVAIVDEMENVKLPEPDTAFVVIDSTRVAVDSLQIAALPNEQNILMGAVAVTHLTSKDEKKLSEEKAPVCRQEASGVFLYPNPVKRGQTVNLSFDEPVSGVYEVYALSGQLVQQGRLKLGKKERFDMPVPSGAAGIYTIRVTDEKAKHVFSNKLIVQ